MLERGQLTRWAVWVVLGKGEFRFEIAAVVKRVGVEDDQRNAPFEDVIVNKLGLG